MTPQANGVYYTREDRSGVQTGTNKLDFLSKCKPVQARGTHTAESLRKGEPPIDISVPMP